MAFALATPLTHLPRITPKMARAFSRLGVETLKDLLWYLPLRYEDLSSIQLIAAVSVAQEITIRGTVREIANTRTFRKHMTITEALVEDASGSLRVIWFNQPWMTQNLPTGTDVLLAGKAQLGPKGIFLSHPAYEILREEKAPLGLRHVGRIVPIYHETEGITSRWIRFLVATFLKQLGRIPDPIPRDISERENLPALHAAVTQAHFPESIEEAKRARERLSFDELFLIECAALQAKLRMHEQRALPVIMDVELIKRFVSLLPFTLTEGQRKAAFQILKDAERNRPMNRLLAGDVGSGKTLVAAIAILNTAQQGYQAALMAPTEILAQQHFRELARLLKPFRVRIAILTGETSRVTPKKLADSSMKISKRRLFQELKAGSIQVLVGTHALIASAKTKKPESSLRPEGPLRFAKLALSIVDEQHRFGVGQRSRLAKFRSGIESIARTPPGKENIEPAFLPHFLTMSATPIPRTLALTIFGDLDLSSLTEMPQGRKPIETRIVPPSERLDVYQFIREQIQQGRQAYVICPLIQESEKIQAKAAEKEFAYLKKEVFPDLRLALLHGGFAAKEKGKVMQQFKDRKCDVLVATSVVEVGIDVPNATVMVIEGTERFGLAQLYQMRGRVGRGEHQSYCFLFTGSSSKKTAQRLSAIRKTESGQELAQEDLKLRGPGELTGTRQSGLPDIAMAALSNLPLIERAREEAKNMLSKDPHLSRFPLLRQRVAELSKNLHFA